MKTLTGSRLNVVVAEVLDQMDHHDVINVYLNSANSDAGVLNDFSHKAHDDFVESYKNRLFLFMTDDEKYVLDGPEREEPVNAHDLMYFCVDVFLQSVQELLEIEDPDLYKIASAIEIFDVESYHERICVFTHSQAKPGGLYIVSGDTYDKCIENLTYKYRFPEDDDLEPDTANLTGLGTIMIEKLDDKHYFYRACGDNWEVYGVMPDDGSEDWVATVSTETVAEKLVEMLSQ